MDYFLGDYSRQFLKLIKCKIFIEQLVTLHENEFVPLPDDRFSAQKNGCVILDLVSPLISVTESDVPRNVTYLP